MSIYFAYHWTKTGGFHRAQMKLQFFITISVGELKILIFAKLSMPRAHFLFPAKEVDLNIIFNMFTGMLVPYYRHTYEIWMK
jgi:hypothetical protein